MSSRLPTILLLIALAACGAENGAPPDASLPPAPERPEPGLRGLVIDEEGEPVPGAVLHARLPYGAGLPGLTGIQTETDVDGKFALLIQKELRPVKDVPVLLRVAADGYVIRTHKLRSFKPGLGQDMVVTLVRAGTVAGRVTTSEGGPVAGGFVYAIRPDAAGAERRTDALSATTDGNGFFRIAALPPGKIDMGVIVEGSVPALVGPVEVVAGEEANVPDLVVRPGSSIGGRVLTPDGAAIPGARVLAYRDRRFKTYVLFGRSSVGVAGGVARTDEEGRFVISGLDAARYTVEAAALGHHGVAAARQEVPVETLDVELTLAPKAWVQCVVRDSETAAAVTSFTIVVTPIEDADGPVEGIVERSEVLSPGGAYRFAARLGRRYRVEVVAEGHYDAAREVGPVEGGQVKPLEILLLPRK